MADVKRENAVERAVWLVGGPTKAANLLGVSGQAVAFWRAAGRMPTDTEEARQRVELLSERSGVTMLDLLGFGTAKPDGRRGKRTSPLGERENRCLTSASATHRETPAAESAASLSAAA